MGLLCVDFIAAIGGVFFVIMALASTDEDGTPIIEILKSKRVIILSIIIAIVCGVVTDVLARSYIYPPPPISYDRECGVCGRTFSDSGNTTSIAKTNMCKNCYNNFEFGMKSIGEW